MLKALEGAAQRGATCCTLTSTATVHRFYLSRGYVEDEQPRVEIGASSDYPMSRTIADH